MLQIEVMQLKRNRLEMLISVLIIDSYGNVSGSQ